LARTYTCSKCKGSYDSTEIRLLPDSQITCVFCLGKKAKDEAPAMKTPVKQEMTEYMCSNCKYQFKRKKGMVVKVCPYCGKPDKVVAKKSLSADKILNDDDDLGINF
jgi:DNA-directed RNA polymerase subunit RPC12/RpoP